MKNNVSTSLFWKLLERFGVFGIQFVLQLVLARLLDPAHYGVLAIMVIFTSLANVFIQSGFNTALIQNKDVTEEDYSSVLWLSLFIAAVLYAIIFAAAPVIASFYQMPGIIAPLRVLALTLLPGAINSVQQAKISREMEFRKVFLSSIISSTVSGIVGILFAYLGFGLWSLVAQNLLNVIVTSLVMWLTVPLKLYFVCNFKRIRILFSYGWKILASGLLDTFYGDLYGLIIGKKFSSETLGFYSHGAQYPDYLIDTITGAVQSVMLPAMSAIQENKSDVKAMTRNSIMISAYIILPMMIGMSVVAEPMILLLLTEKWLPCVPFLQLYCIACAFDPVQTCNLQAINAVGRSDIFLKLEVLKKIYFTIILFVIIFFFDSPIAIAGTAILDSLICWIINAYPNKKLLDYSVFEQVKDLFPSMLITAAMGFLVSLLKHLALSPLVMLVLQVVAGILIYLLLSWIFKPAPYRMLLEYIQAFLRNRTKQSS